ncbi:MAG TPA: sigma-54 dependent transcriptional regulator [Bryobacteraceae bacterium]|jgi:DNA-binding NtrC family response regulator
MAKSRVLIVDDEENQRTGLAAMIQSWGYAAETAKNGQDALDKLPSFAPHAIITDLMMPLMDGREFLKRLAGQIPAIVVTAYGNLDTSVNVVRDLGAFWFLEKPVRAEAVRTLLERAVSQSRLNERAVTLERQLSNYGVLGELTGTSQPMQEVFALIRQAAPSRATILVTGESGTGKELVARAIHNLSPRQTGPFVAVNCAALPETLMESELFGHEKGAFTGAVERRAGCFELAQHGTLLLDEIGDMPLATQAKLLRVLEDSKVRRLGATKEQQVDVRVIAATNQGLEKGISEGRFRSDLYYRLNVFHISLPPLRDRLEDMPVLCAALIDALNKKQQCKITEVDGTVMDMFRAYRWPGNVRELRNVLERALIIAGEGTISPAHLPKSFQAGVAQRTGGASPATGTKSVDGDELLKVTLPVGTTLDQAERELIDVTLRHTNNNKTRAADILGISIKTLFNKLRETQSS